MADQARVTELIYAAIDEYNEGLPEGHGLAKCPDAPLYGPGSHLDSLGLVSLVVTVEQAVAEEYGREVPLANDRTLSRQGSPFRTVRTLADFIVERLETENA
jgi:acyl carrier protein